MEVCSSSTFAGLPDTPKLAGAHKYGLLDGNLDQMASFQSTYKSTLRIKAPVWPEVLQAVLATRLCAIRGARRLLLPPPMDHNQGAAPGSHAQDNTTAEPSGARNANEKASRTKSMSVQV